MRFGRLLRKVLAVTWLLASTGPVLACGPPPAPLGPGAEPPEPKPIAPAPLSHPDPH